MINKVVVKNFKKFEYLEFELPDHLVIAGPNNSGKTTLLQAISSWSEFASQWANNRPDLARERDGNYPRSNLNLLRFNSVPLADFNHLWQNKNVDQPASLWIHTAKWKIGFEILYKDQELADIRPAKDVDENDIEQYINKPLIPIYIPPVSGVDVAEAPYDPVVIPIRLAQAQAGSVLRNLLFAISQDSQKWQTLQEIIRSFFGYELLHPSGGTAQILAGYRHSKEDTFYNLNSAASGFLQVLLVYAALLHKKASILLIDEPDAHLHVLLQNKMYYNLLKHAQENASQLIIATHSERLINAAKLDNLRSLGTNLEKISNQKQLRDTLHLENIDILLAKDESKILYVEGSNDIPILREWAYILQHPTLSFLEKPFVWETAQHKWPPARHFSAMRLIVPDFFGVELCDSDGKDHSDIPHSPEGMIRLYWKRYEIESYLIHPQTIIRFVKSVGTDQMVEDAVAYMRRQLPQALHEDPFELSDYLQGTKAKKILSGIFSAAKLNIKESDYYQIAEQMTKQEINPEVIKKLDLIADHFSIK